MQHLLPVKSFRGSVYVGGTLQGKIVQDRSPLSDEWVFFGMHVKVHDDAAFEQLMNNQFPEVSCSKLWTTNGRCWSLVTDSADDYMRMKKLWDINAS